MCIRYLKFAKFCQYTLYFVAFVSLLVSCYYIYMIEAIAKCKTKATTVIKQSVPLPFEGNIWVLEFVPGGSRQIAILLCCVAALLYCTMLM